MLRQASLQSARRPAKWWFSRSLFLTLATLSLFAAALCGRWLFAEAYATYARENLTGSRGAEQALASAELALQLIPQHAGYQSLRARAERRRGDPQATAHLYRQALKRAPADAVLWRDYALFLLSRGEYGAAQHAIARAQALSPANRGLHLSLGLTGLSIWQTAPPPLRELWSRSIEFRLRHQPKEFLRYVFASGQEAMLCRHFATEPALKDWCYWTRNARQSCYVAGLTPKQRRVCERLGAYLGQGT